MKGDVIPDDNHVLRYCRPKYVNQVNGLPERDAFRLEPGDDGRLSVNWVEHLDTAAAIATRGEREVAVARVRDVIQLGLGVSGAFAFLRVDDVKRAVETGGGANPYVEHDPKGPQPAVGRRPARGPDPSHALVHGFPEDDYGVGVELLALATLDRDLNLFPGRIPSPG